MDRKSLSYHVCWVLVFMIFCYSFGKLNSFIRDGFLIKREIKYMTIAMISEPIMYLILGLMFGVLVYFGIMNKVTRRQMFIELLIIEIPLLITVLNEFVRDMFVNYGIQVTRVYDKPFRSARIIAVTFVFLLYIIRKKLIYGKERL